MRNDSRTASTLLPALAAVVLAACGAEESDDAVDTGADVAGDEGASDGSSATDGDDGSGGADAPADEVPPVDRCDITAGKTWLLSEVRFVMPGDDRTVDGFDVDSRVSGASDAEGCSKPDNRAPDGRTGIDNQFAGLLPLAAAQLGDLDGFVNAQVTLGQLSYIFDVRPTDDSACAFLMQSTDGQVLVDSAEQVIPYQTVALSTERTSTRGTCEETAPCEWTATGGRFEMPFTFLGTPIHIALDPYIFRMRMADDGSIDVLVGGSMPLPDVDIFLQALDGDGTTRQIKEQVQGLIPVIADMFPGDDGKCTGISAALRFRAVPAYVYED